METFLGFRGVLAHTRGKVLAPSPCNQVSAGKSRLLAISFKISSPSCCKLFKELAQDN